MGEHVDHAVAAVTGFVQDVLKPFSTCSGGVCRPEPGEESEQWN